MDGVRDARRVRFDEGDLSSVGGERGAPRDALLTAIRGHGAGEKESIRVLVVDDDHSLCKSCHSVLSAEGYDVEATERGEEALELLRRESFDIVLLDLYMSGVSGRELLEARLERDPETLVIVMTGNPSVESSVDVLRRGAWSYIPKPFSASHLMVLLGRAAHEVLVGRESGEDEIASIRAGDDGRGGELTILGNSPQFRRVIELARNVASTDASVFLVGESGVGKDMVARFIHQESRRATGNYVPVNCAALPENLLESEMFGHVEGAFTGAVRDKRGLLEEADGGTLFLDELTAMPTAVQAKLLRVLQDGVVRRVGSTKSDAVVSVRFIAATNREPAEAIEERTLRSDLYYRLRVVPIEIPPLRDRRKDISTLARHFLTGYWRKHRSESGPEPTLTDSALRALERHPWPGNVRELKNTMEHAVVLLDPGVEVMPEDIPFMTDDLEGEGGFTETGDSRLGGGRNGSGRSPATTFGPPGSKALFDPGKEFIEARDEHMAQWERRFLIEAVRWGEGKISKTARAMGIHRTYLYRLLDKHDLDHSKIVRNGGSDDVD